MRVQRPSICSGAAVFALAAFATGCPSPDPEGKLNRFLDETEEERDEFQNQKMDMGSTLADVTGEFLFAIETNIAPDLYLQFVATTELTLEGTGGTLNITFQPLSLDVGSNVAPREFVGEPIVAEGIPVAANGSFTIESLGEVMVTGEANPITGSDIVAELGFGGFIQDENLFCGTVSGDVISPISSPLTGSTFAATRVEATDPASLPTEFPVKCPEGGSMGGSTGGDSGGGSGDGGTTGG